MNQPRRLIHVGTGKLPKVKSRKRRLPKMLTPEEAQELLRQPDLRTRKGLMDRCMLELMYRAGLRVGEVVNLRIRDVDLETGSIAIFDGKGGDGTAYFDTARVSPLLEEWLNEHRFHAPKNQRLFTKKNESAISVRYVQRAVTRYRDAAGILSKCTPHVLRHTYATELLRDGFNLREVQVALRHAQVSTTEIYAHVLDSELRAKMQRRPER